MATETQAEPWAHSRKGAAKTRGEAFLKSRDGRIRERKSFGGESTQKINRAALIYDFDGTLARGNLQETSFIPEVDMTKEEFWREAKKVTRENNSDEILCYMRLMVEKAKERGIPTSANDLNTHGKNSRLFKGIEDKTWFTRIIAYASKFNLHIENYIISSGIQELIEGCAIYDSFDRVFASKFIYENEIAIWPGVAIN